MDTDKHELLLKKRGQYMKCAIKYLIFLWPISVLVYLIFITLSSQASVDDTLLEANGLIWGQGSEQITVEVNQRSLGEQETFEILLREKNGQHRENFRLTINKDMFGGGFVKAVQVDDDPEFEVIAWGSHEEQESFLLDYQKSQISKIPFTNTSKDIQNIAIQWRQAYVMNGMTFSVFMIFAVGYYIFIGIVWLIVKTVKRGRKKI
ncbi:hypothetical protein JWG39_13580 [Desulforhopalus vacuolatus]|uniref:hypothetical protein n=1 Tax=Desulforhopalus vacuolatus TaxID=40414 RepID=UPI0019645B31|nr:hypothetical protein [Desulforhopalus vacuolatus]MBM9520848.1 hypothetical protein [Desulforhopalus vacuolatus]